MKTAHRDVRVFEVRLTRDAIIGWVLNALTEHNQVPKSYNTGSPRALWDDNHDLVLQFHESEEARAERAKIKADFWNHDAEEHA